METDQLRQQLAELHKELEKAAHEDRYAEDMLTTVMTDIVRVASGDEPELEEGDNLRDRLEKQASDFEVRHPKTAGIMREVTEILAKLGF
ncbi:MAG: DUF4404 family protein [Porticoccaceae bacterium]|nr:DUF4404 family protein [Porticoccaceae bacterium]